MVDRRAAQPSTRGPRCSTTPVHRRYLSVYTDGVLPSEGLPGDLVTRLQTSSTDGCTWSSPVAIAGSGADGSPQGAASKASDYKISPFELESVLLEHPAVAESAIVPAPDPVRMAVPKAVVASAVSGREALVLARSHHPELILLDLRLPDTSPPELIRGLHAPAPALTSSSSPHTPTTRPVGGPRGGGRGCLLKDAGTTDLAASLTAVMAGRRVMDLRLGSRPDMTLRDRLLEHPLTRREY